MRVGIIVALVVGVSGCASGRTSSLLLERQAVGPIEEESAVASRKEWQLTPAPQTQEQRGIEVFVHHASADYLRTFFANREVFGPFAGQNPFYPEHLVFYVKIANRGTGKILVNPADFVLVDDRGSQYQPLTPDYITAFGESRAPVATATRGLLSEAKPGYFGVSVPVGRLVAGKSQGPFALLKQSSLQAGYLHQGVVHDGLVAFWNPNPRAKLLRLLVANIKADFAPTDWPKASLDFTFDFTPGAAAPVTAP